jgi:hypothetical protein
MRSITFSAMSYTYDEPGLLINSINASDSLLLVCFVSCPHTPSPLGIEVSKCSNCMPLEHVLSAT